MTSLRDIVPMVERVPVGNNLAGAMQFVDVTGVSAEGFAPLYLRFPELQKIFAGKLHELAPEQLVASLPQCMAAIIAAGCGNPNDSEAEAIAARLPIDTQLALLTAVLKITMPEGPGPFVARLETLGVVVRSPRAPAVPITESPGKVTDTKSPRESRSSSRSDTSAPGPTPPAA